MDIVKIIFQLVGSLALLLQGMKMMSDGIQKAAGPSLHRILGLMTGNRFFAILTGLFVTMIIQSSGATTVMVVSFVNAGLLSLIQAIGVIFGANIGTTITAWIVTIFGFSFKIAALAIPVFGIGYFLTFFKKIKKENIGEVFMGFGLLFLGLDFLSNAIPALDSNNMAFLAVFNDGGFLGTFIGIIVACLSTVLLHSSSAFSAIVLTMCHNGIVSWEFAAAMILGSNIGSTIDAILASIGTKVNARRAALVHVLFNVSGTVLAIIFMQPLLALVDFITPGTVQENLTIHVSMLHTVFNVLCTIIFAPFIKQFAQLTIKLIPDDKTEQANVYHLEFNATGVKDNAEAYIIRAEKEISDMTNVALNMFMKIKEGFTNRNEEFFATNIELLAQQEDYADQMQEKLSNYLVKTSQLPMNDILKNNISMMLRIVDALENMTDECYSVALLLRRSVDKKMEFNQTDLDRLEPYVEMVEQFLEFIKTSINKHLTQEQLTMAQFFEDQIDLFRKNLKKVARKRLEEGADVRSELLYIDIVRDIEKIGDQAFTISEALAQTR